jgi:ABC-type bacteriocin/lantibiotic exporter with double-glycine peptidase domain
MRNIARKILELQDRILGTAFPTMERVKQISVSHCGPAVLASLYSYLGMKVSQRSIVSSLRAQNKIKTFGFNMHDMAKGAKIAGKSKFSFWHKTNSKVSDLDRAINKFKSPVGVEWQGVFYEDEDEDNGHFSIITKIDKEKGYLRMADPYYKFVGVDRKFKIKEFEKRWWDENMIHGRNLHDKRVMFVITDKNATWPKKLGMSK